MSTTTPNAYIRCSARRRSSAPNGASSTPQLLQQKVQLRPRLEPSHFLSGQHAFHLPRRGLLILARGPKRRRFETYIGLG